MSDPITIGIAVGVAALAANAHFAGRSDCLRHGCRTRPTHQIDGPAWTKPALYCEPHGAEAQAEHGGTLTPIGETQ